MISPTGILPEELMFPEQKPAVLDALAAMPVPVWIKSQLLRGWGQTVQVQLTADDYAAVDNSVVVGGNT